MKKETTYDSPSAILCTSENAPLKTIVSSVNVLSGKWVLLILWHLYGGPVRFGALKRSLPKVTQHTLTQTLRELGEKGLVVRNSLPGKSLHVEYSLSTRARALQPVFEAIIVWSLGSQENISENG